MAPIAKGKRLATAEMFLEIFLPVFGLIGVEIVHTLLKVHRFERVDVIVKLRVVAKDEPGDCQQ